jgi:hypothetical protein
MARRTTAQGKQIKNQCLTPNVENLAKAVFHIKGHNKLHRFLDTAISYKDGVILGIFENEENLIDVNQIFMTKVTFDDGITEFKINIKQIKESPSRSHSLMYFDPITCIKMVQLFSPENKYKVCLAALRKSKQIDFYWNF